MCYAMQWMGCMWGEIREFDEQKFLTCNQSAIYKLFFLCVAPSLHDWSTELGTGFHGGEAVLVSLTPAVDELLAGSGGRVEVVHGESGATHALIRGHGADALHVFDLLLLAVLLIPRPDDRGQAVATHGLTLTGGVEVVPIPVTPAVHELLAPTGHPVVEEAREVTVTGTDCHLLTAHVLLLSCCLALPVADFWHDFFWGSRCISGRGTSGLALCHRPEVVCIAVTSSEDEGLAPVCLAIEEDPGNRRTAGTHHLFLQTDGIHSSTLLSNDRLDAGSGDDSRSRRGTCGLTFFSGVKVVAIAVTSSIHELLTVVGLRVVVEADKVPTTGTSVCWDIAV